MAWIMYGVLCLAGLQGDSDSEVTATVNDVSILRSDVEQVLQRVAGPQKWTDAARDKLFEVTRQQLVDRELVKLHLAKLKLLPSTTDLDLAITRLSKRLEQREQTLEDYLQQRQQTELQLRQELTWRMGWERLLERYLTDENLKKYFEQHRAEFDGTKLRVAHILWKVADEEQLDEMQDKATQVAASIRAGEMTFAKAAQQYSQAPTADKGGELGWIERKQPMPEAFSKAAYQLSAGEVSEPIVSPYGVHIIQCLEVKPGEQDWQSSRAALRDAVSSYLFRWAAGEGRKEARVKLMPVGK